MLLPLTLLTLVELTLAKPLDQSQLVKKSFGSVLNNIASNVQNAGSSAENAGSNVVDAAQADASQAINTIKREQDSLPQPPDGVKMPWPLGNAALTQEAIDADNANVAKGIPNTHIVQSFYSFTEYFQSQENSSLNVIGATLQDPVLAAKTASQALQYLSFYPQRFDQAQAAEPAKSIIEISPTAEQTIVSFGASGAWWPNFLRDFPPEQQQNMSALLFSEHGLQLSGYRYNMGASGDNDSQTVSTPGRGVESFMKTDGTYDFQRDGPGTYYLAAAAKAGASIAFFVNAMPSALAADKKPCGDTLDTTQIPPFVEYIEKVLTFWSKNNITIDYISPMNEPDNDFGKCAQEGMAVHKEDRPAVFAALKTALAASPLTQKIKIMGDESSQIASNAMSSYGTWLSEGVKSIDALSVHMYDWPDDMTLGNYATLVKNLSLPNPPPPIKMTEISSFKSAGGAHAPWGTTGGGSMAAEWDPTMNNALDMARYMWQWLTIVNAESWDWWTAVSNMLPCSPGTTPSCGTDYSAAAGWNDALLFIDPEYATNKNYEFYFTKRYWVFRHFSKFIRPGSVRYDIPNEVLPYGTVAVGTLGVDKTWNALFINRNATAQHVTMKLPGTGGKVTAITETTDKENWGQVEPPVVAADGTVKFTLPAKGVLSMQFTVDKTTVGARSVGQDTAEKERERAFFRERLDKERASRRRAVQERGLGEMDDITLKALNRDL